MRPADPDRTEKTRNAGPERFVSEQIPPPADLDGDVAGCGCAALAEPFAALGGESRQAVAGRGLGASVGAG